ncbi:uncharacterized protein F4812DRAFT_349521 [Daldinia caldariorum]|uniref:uncharacterized protein n=1 Tax=Daldinia caldariorum TaxID=326644 RepID=UPI002008776A|nr:uncharacterized protein F4812DRAFT_349521 [Daldinia caldariorum]KAI1468878.1 hypothetical protein F4812DRAFT_349521 [Daldinia caldariorum]
MGHSYPHIIKRAVITTLLASSALSFTYASSSSSSPSPLPSPLPPPSPPAESPSAETELICHTDNPAECYPKVFSATEEFQTVHDDQDLPPGLHVQLDIQTGQKQAKLYNPAEDENPALQGLPVDRSVVVVDPEAPPDNNSDQPRPPPGAPAYEPVGVVKAPKEKNEGFVAALETVKSSRSGGNSSAANPEELGKALEYLEDLSHDMYYGLQIAEDPDALHALFCLLTARDDDDDGTSQTERPISQRTDFLASSILASAIRNNKPALRALERSWDDLLARTCESATSSSSPPPPPSYDLKSALLVKPTKRSADKGDGKDRGEKGEEEAEAEEAYAARLHLAVLDGLLKSPRIARQFLAEDGMRHLLSMLLRADTDPAWAARKAKVARIVSDVFLDEDLGAELGVWPEPGSAAEDASVCAAAGPEALGDGCWEYHLERISRGPEAPDWSAPLLELVRRRRAEQKKGGEEEEPAAQRSSRDEL